MHVFTVVESKKITPSTLLLTLKKDEEERPIAFQPGQYAAISFRHHGRQSVARCFSIATSPTDQDTLQFGMRVRGTYTNAVSRLKPGDEVTVEGPFGGFVFDASRDKKAVLLAGGIGITPFMSIMRYLERIDADNDVTLLYSVQTQDDIPFADELLKINRDHPGLRTIFVIGTGPTDKLPAANVATGFITPELIDRVSGDYAENRFFICGPPGFMKAMSAPIIKKGVPKGRVMTEAFTQSSPKQTSILRSWPANVYAIGALSLIFGSFTVMLNDLLHTLPLSTSAKPTKDSPFYVTNVRQQSLDQLVNTIPPSPAVITAPSAPTTQSDSSSSGTVPSGASTTPIQTPQLTPVYTQPTPRTTASAPPP